MSGEWDLIVDDRAPRLGHLSVTFTEALCGKPLPRTHWVRFGIVYSNASLIVLGNQGRACLTCVEAALGHPGPPQVRAWMPTEVVDGKRVPQPITPTSVGQSVQFVVTR